MKSTVGSVALCLLLFGCGDVGPPTPPPPPPPPAVTALRILEGNGVEAEVLTATSPAPRVLVLGSKGPLAGIPVRFEPTGGIQGVPSTVADTVVLTNAAGEAGTTWTLGRLVDDYSLRVRAGALPEVRLTARARPGPPAQMRGAGSAPFGSVGEPTRGVPGVSVYDRNFNAIVDHPVSFEVRAGGGTIDQPLSRTDALGTATAGQWTFGPTEPLQVLVARTPLVADSVVFRVVAGPAKIETIVGDSQRVKTNGLAPIAPAVRALDALGKPFPGSDLLVEALGVQAPQGTIRTGPDGIASLGILRMPYDSGTHLVSVRFPDLDRHYLTYFAFLPPPAVDSLLVPAQGSGLAGNFVPAKPAVRVRDAAGDLIAGLTVDWTASAGSSVSRVASLTDLGGVARTDGWRLGTTPGLYRLEARTVPLPPVAIEMQALPVPPPAFAIDVRIRPGSKFTAADSAKILTAARRWERVIVGDIPDVVMKYADSTDACVSALDETIDDLIVFVGTESIDGPGGVLGGASPCLIRNVGRLPLVSEIVVDDGDLSRVDLGQVMLHEFGHALGFGALWGILHLRDGVDDAGRRVFSGPAARSAYHGLASNNAFLEQFSVLIDNSGIPGRNLVHWVEEQLGAELMTPLYGGGLAPLSAITSAAMRDMGYLTADREADPFAFEARLRQGPRPIVLERPPPGRIVVIGSDGRAVGPAAAPPR